jgi:ubiquinone/menaquinone biosynthesis C-methylase UbiE
MDILASLTPSQLAAQLAKPEGQTGLAVMQWVDKNNGITDRKNIGILNVKPGEKVLELGFGTGRTAQALFSELQDIRYTGIEISNTMVDEARRHHADLISTGFVEFILGTEDAIKLPDASFDCVFSIGVAHFWADPSTMLSEIRRVLRPGGRSIAGCLHPSSAPPFATLENGFFIRNEAEWQACCQTAGFDDVQVETLETEQIGLDGKPVTRRVIQITARRSA